MTKLSCAIVRRCAACTLVVVVAATLTLFAATPIHGQGPTLSEIIAKDDELSDFRTLLERNELGKTLLKYISVTVFAPTNAAFARYLGPNKNSPDFLQYHFVKSIITSENFPASLPSEVKGGLPIWVRRNYDQNHVGSVQYDYYANNARIIRKDVRASSVDGLEQILHVIDEVLDPVFPNPDDPTYRNPSAHRLITNPDRYGVPFDFSQLMQQALMHQRDMVLQGGDGHTFFLPMNNDNPTIWRSVDGKVIDAHIIPNQVLFTRAFPAQPQNSLSYNEMLKTTILLTNETSVDQRSYDLQVQSYTGVGYPDYPKGVVVAKVMQANIPVRNGVVHIIENPLVVNNMNVYELLRQNQNLREFYLLVNTRFPSLLDELRQRPITLFAPSNRAFKMMESDRLGQILNSEEKIREMLKLHVVRDEINSDRIGPSRLIESMDRPRQLNLRFSSGVITVLGGGVNATVTVANVKADNGYLHVIDKILGIPYHTIYEKLRSDPGLTSTFRLGEQDNFNQQFTDLKQTFTYFVPSNEAWAKVNQLYPSEFRKLFTKDSTYHATKILQRHVIVNQRFTVDQMANFDQIQMMHGHFKITKAGTKYFVHWEGESAEIMDANVETTNGMVHVISSVLFKRRDLTNEATTTVPIYLTSIATLLMSALVKLIV